MELGYIFIGVNFDWRDYCEVAGTPGVKLHTVKFFKDGDDAYAHKAENYNKYDFCYVTEIWDN